MCSYLIAHAVKPSGHEVPPAAFFEQAAVGHLDPGGECHVGVGVLDGAISLGIADLTVTVDAVEPEQPVLEPRGRVKLP